MGKPKQDKLEKTGQRPKPKRRIKPRLDLGMVDELAKYINAGAHVKVAAQMLGLSPATVYGWMKRGKEEAERISAGYDPRNTHIMVHALYRKATYASASNQMALVMMLQGEAAEGNVDAAKWLLQTRHRQEYGIMTKSSMDDRALGETEEDGKPRLIGESPDGHGGAGGSEPTFSDAVIEVYGLAHTSEPQLPGVTPEDKLKVLEGGKGRHTHAQRKALESPIKDEGVHEDPFVAWDPEDPDRGEDGHGGDGEGVLDVGGVGGDQP